MNSVDVVADYGDLCGEGPLWDARARTLYWTDIAGKKFYRCAWTEWRHELVHEGFQVAGFAFLESGGFVVVNAKGIWLWDGKDGLRRIAEEADGKRCVLNDCVADPSGRLFTGSNFFDPDNDKYELGCLFRVDTDGSVHVVDDGIRLSNGLGFSPDCRTMYFADSASRLIYAYDYRESDGRIANRRALVNVPRDEGVPDGLTVDAEGFVWCAHWFGGCVIRYDPDGKIERRVAIPAAQISSVMFGGKDLTDIFVTSAAHSDALPLAPAGYDPERVYVGGKLFHLNLGIAGKEEYRVRMEIGTGGAGV